MKILILTQIYPSSLQPTRGPYNFNTFRALSQYCETRVIAPRPWWGRVKRPGQLLKTPVETHGGMESRYPSYWSIPRFLPHLNGQALYLSLRREVARVYRTFPFDAIVAAWAYPDAVAVSKLARDYDCPFIVKILGSDINELANHPGLRDQIREGLQQAATVITVSAALKERVVKLGVEDERVAVQHNGVDGSRFFLRDRKEMRDKLGLAQDLKIFCAVGRLSHEKGGDVLLNAIKALRDQNKTNFLLTLVGNGAMEAELKAQAQALGIEEYVRFCGERSHQEIPMWISACDVLCLPSRREGCPNVVLEALACGRPVVAARVGGVPELLNACNGLMVPSEDPKALASGLDMALQREWEPQALRDSVEYLSWDDVGQRYRDVLVNALAERQRR